MRFLVAGVSLDEGIALIYVEDKLVPTVFSSEDSLACTDAGVGETPEYPRDVCRDVVVEFNVVI